MSTGDTIYALSTARGRAAIAIVRLTGPQASDVVKALAGELPAPRSHALKMLRDGLGGQVLDKAVVVWLPGPRSFTGEDCAEFHLHASPAILKAVFARIAMLPACRPAEAGEFTLRAVLNGKMDLVEAEGLGDLLEAQTSVQHRQAMAQALGQSSSLFNGWRDQLLHIRASIEAAVDFADEPGVAEVTSREVDVSISALVASMERELSNARPSEAIRDSIRVVLAGLPNTGKSSLLNALARRDAAIVSDVAGTTRDVIEVFLDLEGYPVLLTDTAGLRDAHNAIEREGIKRSRMQVDGADILVWVASGDVAGSAAFDPQRRPDILVLNKSDIFPASESGFIRNDEAWIDTSTRSDAGLSRFINALKSRIDSAFSQADSALIVSERQKTATRNSIRLLNESISNGFEHLELKAEQVRLASDALGRITGNTDVEEWLGVIFSRFCIGK